MPNNRIEFIDDSGFPPLNIEFEPYFDIDDANDSDSFIELTATKFDGADPTFVTANELVFGIRQIDEEGEAHTIVIGPALAVELMGLLNAWMTQQLDG